jgi:glycosyltransferase involved in cell wall biosynthesis
MKIAVWHNLGSGGAKRALHDHVRGLVARGHTVEAWCPPSADQTYLPLGAVIPEHVVPMGWRPATRRSTRSRVLSPRPDIETGTAELHRHCRRCADEIAAAGFDILLANSCQYLCVPPIGRYARIPALLYLQEPRRILYEALPELPWLAPPGKAGWTPRGLAARLYDRTRNRRVRREGREDVENARAFETILVNSYFSRESILRAYGRDASVCYLGVDTTLFAHRHLPREDFVVGLGAMTPAKDAAFVVRALAAVPAPRPRLAWIGNVADPGYAEHVRHLARTLDVNLDLRVRVGDEELVEALNRASALVYAPRLEPFGFAPLEANACGLPVIAVAEGGVRETVEDGVTGLLVEHDPRAMAEAIARLRDDPDEARRLGESACERVADRWSLSAALDRLERRLQAHLDRAEGAHASLAAANAPVAPR